MQAPTDTMLLDAVDGHDSPVGTVVRRDVFAAQASFRVAHIFVFNAAQELLLQQLAPNRPRYADRWGSSVAAYLFAGETYRQAATRRLEQELGLTAKPLDRALKTEMVDSGCRKFIELFQISDGGPFAPDPGHIADLKFVAPNELDRDVAHNPQRFTPTFIHLWKVFRGSAP